MSSTQKDYIAVSDRLREIWDTGKVAFAAQPEWANGFRSAVQAIAEHFAATNDRFKRDRFDHAVYGEEV